MVIQGINVVGRVLFWINKFVLFARLYKCITQLPCICLPLPMTFFLSTIRDFLDPLFSLSNFGNV